VAEEVGFRFLLHADKRGELLRLMQMMRQRVAVVEKLGIHRPLAVLAPHLVAQQRRTQFGHDIEQQHLVRCVALCVDDIAQPLVGRGQRAVVGLRRRREPAFIDAAAVGAERIIVARVKLDASPRNTKRTRHPRRRQSQNPFACLKGGVNQFCFGCHSASLFGNWRLEIG